MKMEKSPQALIDLFERVTPHAPEVEHKKMFGYPVCFVNGNMWTGLYANTMMMRCGEEMRERAISGHDATIFEPMPGRPMKEYVMVPDSVMKDETLLSSWLAESLEFVSKLPVKGPKPKMKPKT